MLVALTHAVSPNISDCELSFIDRAPIDYALAVEQQDRYCAALSAHGAKVKKLTANLSFPDGCFVEDTALVLDELAVICSMGVPSRRGEVAAIASELAKYRPLARIAFPATLEGGDVVKIGKRLFVALSRRTNAGGVEELTRMSARWGYEVQPVYLRESLHLKSGCAALDDETLLINPEWVDLELFAAFRILLVPESEPRAANALRVGDSVFLQAGYPRTCDLVQRFCCKVDVLDISEFHKAEAALSCLSLIFQS